MIIRESLTYVAARAVPALLSFGMIALFTRLFTAASYGQYALILSVAGTLNIIFFTWASQATLRFYHEMARGSERLLTASVHAFMLSLFLAVVFAAVVAVATRHMLESGLIAAGLAQLLALALLDFVALMLNLQRRSVRYTAVQLLKGVSALLVGGIVAYGTGDAVTVALGISVGWVILALFSMPVRWSAGLKEKPDFVQIRRFAAYGLPLTLSVLLMQVVGTADRWFLAYLGSESDVGQYAAGFDLVQFSIGTLGSALSLSFYPIILERFSRVGAADLGMLRRYGAVQLALLSPAAAGLAIVGPGLCAYLVGPSLRDGAASIIPWICVAMFLGVFKAYYTDLAFQLGHWTSGNAIVAAVTLVSNVALNLFLIPRFGLIGASEAATLAFAIGLGVSIWLGRKFTLAVPLDWVSIGKIFVATGLMAGVIQLVPGYDALGLVVQISTGILVYATAALAQNLLGARDLLVRHVENRFKGATNGRV